MSQYGLVQAFARDSVRRVVGPLLTLLFVGLLVAFSHGYVPALPLLLMLSVAFSALTGGLGAGLWSSALAIAYCAFAYRMPGYALRYSEADLVRLLAFAAALPLVVGTLTAVYNRLHELLLTERNLRTRAEQERAQVENILESISDGFFAVDRQWRYVYVNRQAERLVGRTREELLGQTVWDAFPPLAGSTWDAQYHRAVQQGVAVHFDAYYAPLDTWFETHAYPSREGLTIYLRSIAARKRAEAQLAALARQQAAVATLGRQALRGGDLGALFQAAVETLASTLDVEFVKVLQLLPERDVLVMRAGVGWSPGCNAWVSSREQSQAGYTLASDGPVIVSDLAGETRFRGPSLLVDHGVVSGMSVIISGADQPFGILGAHSRREREFTQDDIHFLQAIANVLAEAIARRRNEEELAESELRFRQLADNVHEVFYIVALDPRQILYISPAYATVWGRSCQSLYEDPGSWLEVVHPDDREPLRTRHSAAAPSFDDREYRLLQPGGHVRFIRDRSYPVLDEHGSVHRLVGIAEDITCARLAAQAEARIAASDAALRARDEVLAVVAHDLRNPLSSIALGTRLLAGTQPAPDEREYYLGSITRSVNKAQRLIQDLLETARLESGQFAIEPRALAVASIVSEARDSFVAIAADKGVALEISVAPGTPAAFADADRIQQALSNLLANALRFTPTGGRIQVRAQPAGDAVEISVHDTGPGIARDALPRIFDRFWRAHPDDRKGLGLGLAIVKGIVDAHGGRVWARSEPGHGSSFHFVVPSANSLGAAGSHSC